LYAIIPLIFLVSAVIIYSFSHHGPPYKSSDLSELENLLKELKLKKGKIVDLGSGDGRVVKLFAEKGFYAHGIETNLFLYFYSLAKLAFGNVKNAKIQFGNFWNVDYSKFDIIYIFGLYKYNRDYDFILGKKLKKNAVVIAYKYNVLSKKHRKMGNFYVYG
jgi:SAM-dependent methyltransferase